MEIIVPCAGRSSRFPNMRPKYLLSDYRRRLMVAGALEGVLGRYPITITILQEHVTKYDALTILQETFGDQVKIVVLEEPTASPAQTVVETLSRIGLTSGSFLIRDCDSFFDMQISEGNKVYTSSLSANPRMNNVAALGFVISNDQRVILKLVEKRVVSDSFCAGAYQFAEVQDFLQAYAALQDQTGELYISNVIDFMIANGKVFSESLVENYVNVGTAPAWHAYNNRPTIFCDIDGTIVTNQSAYGATRYDKGTYKPLQANIDALKKFLGTGSIIIFTTARSKAYFQATREMLDALGFADCQLIMELNHSKRILINDHAPSNPYPASVAINLVRDTDRLEDYLHSFL